MIYAIPVYLYVEVPNEAAARQEKAKIEVLMKNPMLKSIMDGQQIPSRGVNVMDPVIPST